MVQSDALVGIVGGYAYTGQVPPTARFPTTPHAWRRCTRMSALRSRLRRSSGST